MGYKLHRNSHTMFRRRRPVLRLILSVLSALAVVAVGFFVARWMDRPPEKPPVVSQPDNSVSNDEQEQDLPANTTPVTVEAVRGFYLPHKALTDTDELADTLQKAANAGFNTLLFDLKDSEGRLYYRFTSQTATQVNSYTEDALTDRELSTLLAAVRQAGMQAIPRLYAFRDHAGARALSAARIAHTQDPSWVWYDADPSNGGKAWLNPYADEAHLYILSLAEELKEAGVAGVLLDGVQFPSQTSGASFGKSSNTAMERSEILTAFVDKLQTALGTDFPVLLASTGRAALGKDTSVYGGNPLTFGADQAVPQISLSAMPASVTIGETVLTISQKDPQGSMEALVNHMVLRLKVTGDTTTLTPWLNTDGQATATVKQLLTGCQNGGATAVILYNAAGQYDFAALGA